MNEDILNTLCEYVINKEVNEDKQETLYNELEDMIRIKGSELRNSLVYEGGIYYPIELLLNKLKDIEIELQYLILDYTKSLGIEYFTNTLYRVTD